MYRYAGFALTIDSELELPELLPLSSVDYQADVSIRIGTWPYGGLKSTLYEEFASTLEVADFVIRHGREIIVNPRKGVDPALLRVVLLGKIMAFLLRQRGWLPLHGSAVVVDGTAALFLGVSGSGKSTTAAAFHAAGHLVVADDVAGVCNVGGNCVVRPAPRRLRLTEDSRQLFDSLNVPGEFQVDKHSYDLGRGRLTTLFKVTRIYVLAYGDYPRSEKIAAVEAATLLDTHTFIKRWRMDREVLSASLNACVEIARITPVYRVFREKSLGALPELVALVTKELSGR